MPLSRRSLLLAAFAPRPSSPWLYIGAYTGGAGQGISVARFDPASGTLGGLELAAEAPQPTFLALHPNNRFLYAIHEIGDYAGRRTGSLGAYAIDRASGRLSLLNRVTSGGPGPCHLSLDKRGRMAMTANYAGGSVASYSIQPDGRLSEPVSFIQHAGAGPDPKRQERPHAHSINVTPDNQFAVVCDLGIDEVVVYRIQPAKGTLEKHGGCQMAAGAGPRHLAWHPKLPCGYVANELNSTVTVVHYSDDGVLDEVHSLSTVPAGFSGKNYPAEVCVHPSGRWVYVSNRGENTVATFAVDANSGKLGRVSNTPTEGVWPRNIYVTPDGRWLLAANQNSNSVRVFALDQRSGLPRPTGQGLSLNAPVCLRMMVR